MCLGCLHTLLFKSQHTEWLNQWLHGSTSHYTDLKKSRKVCRRWIMKNKKSVALQRRVAFILCPATLWGNLLLSCKHFQQLVDGTILISLFKNTQGYAGICWNSCMILISVPLVWIGSTVKSFVLTVLTWRAAPSQPCTTVFFLSRCPLRD